MVRIQKNRNRSKIETVFPIIDWYFENGNDMILFWIPDTTININQLYSISRLFANSYLEIDDIANRSGFQIRIETRASDD